MENNNILNHQIENKTINDFFNNNTNNTFINNNKNNNKIYKYIKYLGNSNSNNLFGSGEIHLVKNKNIKKKLLCKIIDLDGIENKETFKKKLNKELKLYNFIRSNPSGIKYINPCLYKEYLNNMIYLYFNNKIGYDLNHLKRNNKTFLYILIKKILLGLKSLHNIDIPHLNINNESIIVYYNNKSFQVKFTNFSTDKYNIKKYTKKKNKDNYKLNFYNDINYLKKKDVNTLGNTLIQLLSNSNNFNFFGLLSDDKIEKYKDIINTQMLCPIDNVDSINNILKDIIYYDKYRND